MTLDELVAQIQDDLEDERITADQCQDAISNAIKFYERKSFWFNTPIVAIPFTANKSVFTVTDNAYIPNMFDVKRVICDLSNAGIGIKDLTAYNPQNTYPIIAVSSPTYPRHYTYFEQKLTITPVSSYPGTLTILATVKFAALASGGASNAWTNEATELIRSSAKRRLALHVFHDREIAEANAILERENLEILEDETKRKLPEVLLMAPIDLVAIGRAGYYDVRLS